MRIWGEHTTARRAALACLLAASAWANGEIDPRRPYLTAAARQTRAPEASNPRWFEIEIENLSSDPARVSLRVYDCRGLDPALTRGYLLPAGQTQSLRIERDRPCAEQLDASAAARSRPPRDIFILAAFLQPVLPGVSLRVKAQSLHGDTLQTYASEGMHHESGRASLQGYTTFRSALVLNLSNADMTVRTCRKPGPAFFTRARACVAGSFELRRRPNLALLLTSPEPEAGLDVETVDRRGFIEVIAFDLASGHRSRFQVDSQITYQPDPPD